MPGVAPDSASTDSPRQPLQPGVDGVSLDMNADASLKNRKGGALGSGSCMGSKSSFRLAFPWSQQDGAGRANKYAYADEVDNFKVWLDKTRDRWVGDWVEVVWKLQCADSVPQHGAGSSLACPVPMKLPVQFCWVHGPVV